MTAVQNQKEDVMAEKVMNLHLLLYAMAALGGLGAALRFPLLLPVPGRRGCLLLISM